MNRTFHQLQDLWKTSIPFRLASVTMVIGSAVVASGLNRGLSSMQTAHDLESLAPQPIAEILQRNATEITPEQQQLLQHAFASMNPEQQKLYQQLVDQLRTLSNAQAHAGTMP